MTDEKNFEALYFRPFRFTGPDKTLRVHSVQYVAWPQYTWERLRKEKPDFYEAAIDPAPDPAGWFHARIEVTKKKARVYVDGAKEPSLVVDRVVGREAGKVGLWVDSKEGAFANLRITVTSAQ